MLVSSTILSNSNTADCSCLPPDCWLFLSTTRLLTLPVYHHTDLWLFPPTITDSADCSSLPSHNCWLFQSTITQLLTVPIYHHTHCWLFQSSSRLMTVPVYHHTTADYSSLRSHNCWLFQFTITQLLTVPVYDHTTADCSSLPSDLWLLQFTITQLLAADCYSLPSHNCWLFQSTTIQTAHCSSLPYRHCWQFQPSITHTHRQQSTFKDSGADCSRI